MTVSTREYAHMCDRLQEAEAMNRAQAERIAELRSRLPPKPVPPIEIAGFTSVNIQYIRPLPSWMQFPPQVYAK